MNNGFTFKITRSIELLVLSLFFLIFIIGCSESKQTSRKTIASISINDIPICNFKSVDSFRLNINLSAPRIIDKLNNFILIIDEVKSDTLFIFDSNSKKVHNKICISGEGPMTVGNFVYSIGFLNDKYIVASGSNGYVFYDFSFKPHSIFKKIPEKLPQSWGGRNFKLIAINKNNDTILISNRNQPFDISLFHNASKQEEKSLTSKLTFLTTYSVAKNIFETSVPIERNNKILKFDRSYPDIIQYWDFNHLDKSVYSIINPDFTVCVYNLNGSRFDLVKEYEVNPKYFREDYMTKLGKKPDDPLKQLLINSAFVDLHAQKNMFMYTYLLGMPEDEFDSYKNEVTLFNARNAKYYPPVHVLYENGKLKCEDCVLSSNRGDNIQLIDKEGYGYSILNHESKNERDGLTIFKFDL